MVVAALLAAPAASAQDSSVGTYGGGGNLSDQVAGAAAGDPGDPSDPPDPGALPFTGLDLGLALGGGLLLIAVGATIATMAPRSRRQN